MSNRVIDDAIVVSDTVTKLGEECVGRVVISGSHGGVYAAYCACKAKARGVILNDAGRGKDDAGIGGGAYCQDLDTPYAAVDTLTARIGNGGSMADEGLISFANPLAAALGVEPGMPALEAARRMAEAALSTKPVQPYAEARQDLPKTGKRMIVLMDSISLVEEQDAGRIVVSGSHGGMLGADKHSALVVDAFAGFFHDAGGGKDGAGLTRLPALDERGIAAGTVAAASARIGDGRSIYEDGVLSHVNETTRRLGGAVGMPAKTFIDRLAGL